MFWNRARRRWERHPDCRCAHDPCYCRWLRPLDAEGRPIPHPILDALREREQPTPVETRTDDEEVIA